MSTLQVEMAQAIRAGLQRRAVTSCSRWAEKYRVMGTPYPGPWSFRHHPWLKEMHDRKVEIKVGQKGAQLGFTEWALNETFFAMDVLKLDCLYVLPAQVPDAHDFSNARFGTALKLSEYLAKMFSQVNNIGHKVAGENNLYIRGSRAENSLKSIPTAMIVLDEVDEMAKESIKLAWERAAGQNKRRILMLSTPTFPNEGINRYYNDSTMEHFMFRCPCCSRFTELIFPDCLEITAEDVNDPSVENSHLICKECKGTLPHETKIDWLNDKTEWVKSFEQRSIAGFHVNQLYSMANAVRPPEIAKDFLKSLRDPSEEQSFYNSKIGIPHIIQGAGVMDSDIDACIKDYRKFTTRPSNALITMGIDVGRFFHYEIDQWFLPEGNTAAEDLNVCSFCKVISFGKVKNIEEVEQLMRQFGVSFAVIDAHPERRTAFQFASRFHGFVKMNFYGNGINGKQINVHTDEEYTITVDRTSWLDLALGRFRNPKMLGLPRDVDMEYRANIKAPIRVYEKDKNGNNYAVYREGPEPDHYAHARTYAEIALQFAAGMLNPSDIVR